MLEELGLNQKFLFDPFDTVFALAKKGEYSVSPNPMVGAIILNKSNLVGYGYHLFKGDDHAEVKAIKMAGILTQNASLYINLEPCCHFGATPPCTDLIISSGIKKVYFSHIDPNPLVAGKAIKILQRAGVEVEYGFKSKEAKKLNEIFIFSQTNQSPFVIAKWAMTMDGRMAAAESSKWISGEESRSHAHALRNSVDAILVGSNTIIKDNPLLNVRREDLPVIREPWKIILTSEPNKIMQELNIFKNQAEKVLIIPTNSEDFSLHKMLKNLYLKGITSVLVEGGSYTLTKFLKENLINRFYCYIAPKFIAGTDSLPAFSGDLNIKEVKDAKGAFIEEIKMLGEDVLIKGGYKNVYRNC